MKIVLISDTHTKHNQIKVPDGDMIIHAGDLSSRGRKNEIRAFFHWFKELPHKYKILIAGNHDFAFETDRAWCDKVMPENIHYLNDCGVTIEGINIWGSPVTPAFYDWAFNRLRGLEISKYWELIPEGTNILVTHGPPYGYGDLLDPRWLRPGEKENVGCEDLLYYIEKIKPKLHVFGHIHYNGGLIESNGDTLFVNASNLTERYLPRSADPIVIDWGDINTIIKDYKI